ncbi:MAG: metal-dependent transcriptional regulator [Clostridia bacterium]|nr:metal-dependent transcriptional regulator [Clostridia bacterium]
MSLHESGQMYLESILVLHRKNGAVRSIDVVEYMGYSKPSVSRAVGLLKKADYVTVDGSGYITLTEKGKAEAEKIYDRHRVIAKILMEIGVDENIATEDACKIEHVISDESIDAIKKHLQNKD